MPRARGTASAGARDCRRAWSGLTWRRTARSGSQRKARCSGWMAIASSPRTRCPTRATSPRCWSTAAARCGSAPRTGASPASTAGARTGCRREACCRGGASPACWRMPRAASGSAPTAACSACARRCSPASRVATDSPATTCARCWRIAMACCGWAMAAAWTGSRGTAASTTWPCREPAARNLRYSAWPRALPATCGSAPSPTVSTACAAMDCCATTPRPMACPAGTCARSASPPTARSGSAVGAGWSGSTRRPVPAACSRRPRCRGCRGGW